MNSLEAKYKKEILAKLKKQFNIENNMAVPTVQKIIVNAGIGKEYTNNQGIVEEMTEIISEITGQRPVVKLSKESISNFKLREGTPNGLKVTLRGERMWDFLDKLINFTLPRFKDFRGVSRKSFDNMGGYTLGIPDHSVFPEIDPTKYVKLRSLQVVINTSATNNEQAVALLEDLGMPFEKVKEHQNA